MSIENLQHNVNGAASEGSAPGKKMQPVKAVQDDSCHWYVIPLDMVEGFYELLDISKGENDNAYEAEDKFIEKFSGYMTGGDLNNVQLYAEI